MAYNTRSRRLKGAGNAGCQPGLACLDCVKQLRNIALRGPRDFSFAAWVMKTAKAAWSRRATCSAGICVSSLDPPRVPGRIDPPLQGIGDVPGQQVQGPGCGLAPAA